jgi:hypothetical protein
VADALLIGATVITLGGCRDRSSTPPSSASSLRAESSVTLPPITDVLARHTPELMALDGVTGTGEGAEHGKPIVVVFVVKDTPELRARLPKSLEGYPVVIRASGEVTAPPR